MTACSCIDELNVCPPNCFIGGKEDQMDDEHVVDDGTPYPFDLPIEDEDNTEQPTVLGLNMREGCNE